MNLKLLSFIFVLLLSFSLVAAVQVSTDDENYARGEQVQVSVTSCTQGFTVRLANPSGNTILVDGGDSDLTFNYNTASDLSDGTYTVSAQCEAGTPTNPRTATTTFCVGAACATTTPPRDPGGGGGRRCRSEWKQGSWSYCNNQLKQTRTIIDLTACAQPRVEERSCAKCDEQWICKDWSSCVGGQQTRECNDAHNCGKSKPANLQLGRVCSVGSSSSQQRQVSGGGFQPPVVQPPVQQPTSGIKSFWEKFKWLILGGILLLLIAIIVVILLATKKDKKKAAIDPAFLKARTWIEKERSLGMDDDKIKAMLTQHGWQQADIQKAFQAVSHSTQQKAMLGKV